MATFGKATFNTAIYASFRPTYPRQLFDYVFKYHERSQGARWDTAIDLGCGTGQATTELTPFKRVIGVDPSQSMVDGARKHVEALGLSASNQFEFVKSGAEDLGFFQDESVDLITAAQAAHWFDWGKMWPEAGRVLRTGGSAAFWIYSEFRLTHYPTLASLITDYAQGTDPATSLGPHWQRPGRTILEDHLVDVPEANAVVPGAFTDLERVYFTGPHYPALPTPLPIILRKRMTWTDLLSYLRTWSSLHTYHERYPEDLQHPEGDIAVRFWRDLKEGVQREKGPGAGVEQDGDEVDLEWPLAVILVKKV